MERQEKKERKEQRKEIKKNPHFDFIEANEPTVVKKKDLREQKKVDAAMFNFTEENKHLQGHKVTRQMVRQAKHTSVGSSGAGGSAAASGAGVLPSRNSAEAGEILTTSGGSEKSNSKEMTTVDLAEFLLRHPMHRMRGTTWNYMHFVRPSVGTLKRERMVVLNGGGVRVEAFFELLEGLAEDYDVLAPMFPRELNTFEDYIAGIDLLLASVSVPAPFHLMGVALGGMVALEYAQQHPKRIRSLVLSHTAPPSAEFGTLCARYASKAASGVMDNPKEAQALPSALSRALMGHHAHSKDLARDVPAMIAVEGMVRFWKKMLRRFQLDAGSIQAKIEAMAKHHQETRYDESSSFAALLCPVLLLDSERSDAFSQRSWESLQRLLPRAHAQMWEAHGALAVFVRGDEMANTVLKWMAEAFVQEL